MILPVPHSLNLCWDCNYSEGFHDIPQSLNANGGNVTYIRQQPLPCVSVPILLLLHPVCGTYKYKWKRKNIWLCDGNIWIYLQADQEDSVTHGIGCDELGVGRLRNHCGWKCLVISTLFLYRWQFTRIWRKPCSAKCGVLRRRLDCAECDI
jgi:hypothetical protein